MTLDQKVVGMLGALIIGSLAVLAAFNGVKVPNWLSPTTPQAMCSSKDVEITLHKLWVDMLSNTTITGVLGLPDDAFNEPTEGEIAVNFEFKQAADRYTQAGSSSSPDHNRMGELFQEKQRIRQKIVDDYKARHPPTRNPPSDITFVSEPIAVDFNPDLHRVICDRQLTTTNGLVSLSLAAEGKRSFTTRYSVQPNSSSGSYIVSILDSP